VVSDRGAGVPGHGSGAAVAVAGDPAWRGRRSGGSAGRNGGYGSGRVTGTSRPSPADVGGKGT